MATERRTPRENKPDSGIYLGKVVNYLDTRFMGGLEVELLKRKGAANTTQRVQCKYASPFYGVTPYTGAGRSNTYASTQKSYGMWMVPPDIGTLVLVFMPEGDYANAFWMGCVPEPGMNFMIPGYASTEYSDGGLFPVGEYNKQTETAAQPDATKYTKPVNPDAKTRLTNAGLDKDWARGTNTSSARREIPSSVFGISTPGPVDKQGPTHRVGSPGLEINAPYNRLGGSSFVMDDGDMNLLRKKPAKDKAPEYAQPESGDKSGDPKIPANELIRIQTRTGHQILLHNSEDLIYISHGSGKSWIEMTANGKIDIYSEDSISVRSDNDLNFSAGRSVNIEAEDGNINLYANKDIRMQSNENYVLRATGNGTIDIGGNNSINVGGNNNETITGRFDQTVSGTMVVKSEGFIELTSGADTNITALGSIGINGANQIRTSAPTVDLVGSSTINLDAPRLNQNGGAGQTAPLANEPQQPEENEDWALVPQRVPTFEPYKAHEHLDPESFKPDQTKAIKIEDREDPSLELPPVPDTFKKV
jgi:uncharacterized protein (DUF2345 family)